MFRRLIVILLAAVACLLPASESVSATAAVAGDADTYDATIGRRADVPARALDIDWALARGAWEALAGTTTVDAAPFTYDGSPVARVDVHEFDDGPTSQARLGDAREGSALPPAMARGTSTTPLTPVVATNFVQSAPSSRLLGESLEAAGTVRPGGSAAHHIVAGGAGRAADARAALTRFGIDINAADNGVFLPANLSSANAATFRYDDPTISRVEVHELDVAPANPARLSGSREGSALPRVATRGVSTTLLTRDIATNTVRSTSIVDDVIAETQSGARNLTSRYTLTADEALTAGERWVGSGYTEIGKPGSGVFRSADGTRQFRIDNGSITGAHSPGVPHVHLETIAPGSKVPVVTNHIPIAG